jgi:hypothetical protein
LLNRNDKCELCGIDLKREDALFHEALCDRCRAMDDKTKVITFSQVGKGTYLRIQRVGFDVYLLLIEFLLDELDLVGVASHDRRYFNSLCQFY